MGDDFREWYGKISKLRSLPPSNTPVVALTATATHCVKDRIVHALQMAPVHQASKSTKPSLLCREGKMRCSQNFQMVNFRPQEEAN